LSWQIVDARECERFAELFKDEAALDDAGVWAPSVLVGLDQSGS
jgi:hypothetical protein